MLQYLKLVAQYPTLSNVQDAQGWSIINHAMSKGNASVAATILNSIKEGSGTFGLISAVPYTIHTSVKFHHEDPSSAEDGKVEGLADKSVARMMSFFGGKSFVDKSFKRESKMERTSSPMDPSADKTCEWSRQLAHPL